MQRHRRYQQVPDRLRRPDKERRPCHAGGVDAQSHPAAQIGTSRDFLQLGALKQMAAGRSGWHRPLRCVARQRMRRYVSHVALVLFAVARRSMVGSALNAMR
jgi:hypothetical protein